MALTGAVVAIGMHLLVGWSWLSAAMFGALIASTDPVSVIAAFKEMKVEPWLSLLVEAESLLNDGSAAVAFGTSRHRGFCGTSIINRCVSARASLIFSTVSVRRSES